MNKSYSVPPQDIIQYGFMDFAGNEWPDSYVDAYNNITKELNKTADREITPGSLVEQERQFLLDQRHKLFAEFLK